MKHILTALLILSSGIACYERGQLDAGHTKAYDTQGLVKVADANQYIDMPIKGGW